MKAFEVGRAFELLERRVELNGYLEKIKAAETIKVEIEPTFILLLTKPSMQELIDRICKQYANELNEIEKTLEELGVTPD